MLSRKDGGRTMVTTLGSYTDEKYDTTMYHVRTILVDLDASGDVETGNVVIFSSRDALSKDGFDTYARQYLTKDFGDVEMTVSRYTTGFEAVDAFLYRPGQIPLELSISLTKKEISSSGKLGKLGADASILGPDTICYESCYLAFGRTCAYGVSDPTDRYCTINSELVCVDVCYETSGGGGGPGGGGTSGGGGGGDEEEEDCSCSNPLSCDLADEYTSSDQGSWSCSKFNQIASKWRVGKEGYENKHNGLGYISLTLEGNVIGMGYEFGMTFNITSAYRCPVGNSKVSDATKSQHKYGTAADLNPPWPQRNRWTQDFKREIAVSAVRERGAGWSKYNYSDRNHVHVDWGPSGPSRPLPWSD